MSMPGGRAAGLLLAAAVLLAGCGKKPEDTQPGNSGAGPGPRPGVGRVLPAVDRAVAEADLKSIGLAYHSHLDAAGPPANVEGLARFYESPKLTEAIKNGTYVIIWGADPRTTPEAVLGYVHDVPSKGGVVLLGNGGVKTMTAEEFKAAPKAKGK